MEPIISILKQAQTTHTEPLNHSCSSAETFRICPVCNDPLGMDFEVFGVIRKVPLMCKCRDGELQKRKEHDQFNDLQRKLLRFKKYSLMDENFLQSTFENWKFRGDNKRLYELGKRYCNEWETMKSNNRGLLLYGGAGTGKTYLSFAIANELYKKGVAVLAISASQAMQLIQETYKNNSDTTEIDVLNVIRDASLLIFDDLGTETKTHWAYNKLYNAIDTRYRAKKPIIITTNLDSEGLKEHLSIIDSKSGTRDYYNRIYDRIIENCPLIDVKGNSWRIHMGNENKKQLLKELGFII